jgi:diketogulonate reductase-like aldo/keto reductase
MIKILKDGKSLSIGASNFSIDELQKTIQKSDISPAVNQIEFHPSLFQENLLRFCKNNKIQVDL